MIAARTGGPSQLLPLLSARSLCSQGPCSPSPTNRALSSGLGASRWQVALLDPVAKPEGPGPLMLDSSRCLVRSWIPTLPRAPHCDLPCLPRTPFLCSRSTWKS